MPAERQGCVSQKPCYKEPFDVKVWPYDTIRELLAIALISGEASATLANNCEAKLFRFAIYNFRRIYDKDNAYGNLSVTIDDKTIKVKKSQQMTEVVILQQQES
jgi:hypothetical protein